MDLLNLKIVGIAFFVLFSGYSGNAQEDTTYKELKVVDIYGKKTGFKKVGLYDNELEEEYNIRGFTQLTIFENELTDEFWTSEGKECISGSLEGEESSFLNLKWNKDLDGCDWVGFGFGWDFWTGKDMGYVYDTLALELTIKSNGKPFTNLPWAFCIEDYSGQQGWLGYNKSFLLSKEIGSEWTKVEIPLSLFPFEENDVDLTSVKQLMIQVFSEGQVEIKRIGLVPFSKKLKKEVHAVRATKAPSIDGKLTDWMSDFQSFGDGHKFSVTYSSDSLYVALKIKDSSPRTNGHDGGELWNGDAVEIAFSTNPKADEKRKFLLLSDQHVGVNCGKDSYVWNWKEETKMNEIVHAMKETDNGYSVELAIPFKELYQLELSEGVQLDFEIAIDLADKEIRSDQQRWNSANSEGFHKSPKNWGVMMLD
jgi:hypothetical protein